MHDRDLDRIELAALMAHAPEPNQALRADAEVADLERKLAAARQKRDQLAADGGWDSTTTTEGTR